jgi:hypothetical protein
VWSLGQSGDERKTFLPAHQAKEGAELVIILPGVRLCMQVRVSVTLLLYTRAANNKTKAGGGVRLNEISVGDMERSALGHLLAIYHPANMKLSIR